MENADEAEEEDEEQDEVYIPGGGRLDRLNTRDLRRLNQEAEFDTRFVTQQCKFLNVLLTYS